MRQNLGIVTPDQSRWWKNEFFHHRDWDGVSVESFMGLLDGYIRFYNERRKKQSLGWMNPVQYRISKGLAA